MLAVNKIFLSGNIGQDPAIKMLKTGTKLAELSIAVSYKSKGEQTTDWFNVKAFGKVADIIEQYMQKGDAIYIEGKLQNNSFTNAEGKKITKTDIIAFVAQIISSKRQKDKQENPNSTVASPKAIAEAPPEEETEDLPF